MIDLPWTPPASPDPFTILQEAMGDTQNGRYEIALEKHRWYHDHALELAPAQYGVRLSFALGFWHHLAKEYPPAMAELKALRDNAAEKTVAGTDVHESFHEALAFNRVLNEPAHTRNLFLELHNADSDHASIAYPLAQPVLIAHGDYAICNQYIDANEAINRLIEAFQLHRDPASGPSSDELREYAENSFRNESATVVAILVKSDRQDDAQKIAKRIIAEWDDESVHAAVNGALDGKFPSQQG